MAARKKHVLQNAAQAKIIELGLTAPELARVAGYAISASYLWRSGGGRPNRAGRRAIAKRWPEIAEPLWDLPPPGKTLEPQRAARMTTQNKREQTAELGEPTVGNTEPGPAIPELLGQYPSSGTTGSSPGELAQRAATERRVMTATERHAVTALRLRALDAQVDEAIETLTDVERITAHAGFRAMRAQLLSILECDSRLHAQMCVVLPEPDPDGAAAKLRAIRTELEAIQRQKDEEAAHLMSLSAFTAANKIDAQTRRVKALLSRARLSAAPIKDLLKLECWKMLSQLAANVLREDREALDVSREELAVSSEPFAQALAQVFRETGTISWPCPRYQKDIIGFFRDILGCEPWGKMREMLLLVQDNDWAAVRSGHRVSKTFSLSGIGLWFYSSFEDARVFLTAPTERQLIEVDWREIRMQLARSGVCVDCVARNKKLPIHERIKAPCPHSAKIDGEPSEKPKGGLRSEDFRQVIGFTSRDPEGAQGLAGRNVMFLGDEASGIVQSFFDALKGNLAGGAPETDDGEQVTAKLILFGNPTRNEGEFYEAFHSKAKDKDGKGLYATMTISSWDSPNVEAGRVVVPGLATRDWCEARKEEWGEDSAQYKVRVLGVHAVGEDGRLFSVHLITECEQRWQLEEFEGGALMIGVDPAGPNGLGDESGFAPRRGKKILEVYTRTGLDEDAHLSEVLALIAKHGERGEVAIVNVDCEGVGAGICSRFEQYAATNPGVLRVVRVRASSAAQREVLVYDRWRDELSSNFAQWCRQGGAIPADLKLSAEMHAHELRMKLTSNGERMKVTPKEAIIKLLKRSPDRYDACALSCWEHGVSAEWVLPPKQAEAGRSRGGALDPYAGIGPGSSTGAIDPYG